jgi:hypothetical protein
MRRCNKCGVEFPLTSEHFYVDRKAKYGLSYCCKACTKQRVLEWQIENREYKNEYSREWCANNHESRRASIARYSETHHDSILERGREYREEHRQIIRIKSKMYDDAHKEQKRERERQRRLNNPERERERQRRWRQENPGHVQATVQRRRARRKELECSFSYEDWQRALDYFDNRCAVCGKQPDFWTVLAQDHWLPLDKGGPTVVSNILPLCHPRPGVPAGEPCCNSSKGNKYPEEWLTDRFGKRKAKVILNRIQRYFDWLTSR